MAPDRGTVRQIMTEIERAVKEVAARHGLEFSHQRAKFSSTELATRVTLKTVGTAAVMEDFGRMQFPVLAHRLGLPEDALGQQFNHRGYGYTIVDLKLERPKYPVSCKRMLDGKPFKFPVLIVKNALEREAGRRLTSGAL